MATAVLMYDGINSLAAGIARAFPNAVKVAGYVNGRYAWSQAEWDLFPHADHVRITVTASANAGDVLDVETGDATPAQAAAWIEMRHAAGLYRPTAYCSLSVVPDVRRETGSLILGRDYDIWVAKYDRSPSEPAVPGLPAARFAAKQYESDADWDITAVYDTEWPHRQPAHPAPVAAPGGLSATATEARMSWAAIAGVASYRYQVRDGAGAVRQWLTKGTFASVPLSGPGPHSWRVQAAGGAWTAWLAIGLGGWQLKRSTWVTGTGCGSSAGGRTGCSTRSTSACLTWTGTARSSGMSCCRQTRTRRASVTASARAASCSPGKCSRNRSQGGRRGGC